MTMNIKGHKKAFEQIYSKLEMQDKYKMSFPLIEIGKLDWGRGKWSNEYYSYFYKRFSAHILSKLALTNNQKVLSMGCGRGSDEKNIKTLFSKTDICSIDISLEMIKRAIHNLSPSRFSIAITEKAPFPDNSFDRIIAREVIEHVMDPALMLKEVSRILKPGGIAVITTENGKSLAPTNYFESNIKPRIAKIFKYNLKSLPYKDKAPTLAEMKSYIDNAGLTLQEVFYDGALYHCLSGMGAIFKSKLPGITHYFSCLENNQKLAFAFCDQIKYVLKKRGNKTPAEISVNGICYVCPQCKSKLIESNKQYKCSQCNRLYPITDGIPDFIPYNNESEAGIWKHGKETVTLNPTNLSFISKILNFTCSVVLPLSHKVYVVIYLSMAIMGSCFVKKNKRQLSHILSKDDHYQKYLNSKSF